MSRGEKRNPETDPYTPIGKANLEVSVEALLHKRVSLLGGTTFKFMPTKAGNPDRVVIWPWGRVDLVELKKHDGKPSEVQKIAAEKLARMNVTVVVLPGHAQVVSWVNATYREWADSHDTSRGEAS